MAKMAITKRGERILYPIFWIACINFIIFWVVGVSIGGDAINGSVEDGKYYLSSHGKKTQVSRELFNYSYIHAISVCITHPSIFVAGFLLYLFGQIRFGH